MPPEEEAPLSTAEPPGGYGAGPSSKDFGPSHEAEAAGKGRIKSLVVVGLVLATLSTVLVLGVVWIRRYIVVAKTAEGRLALSRMTRDAARVYEEEHRVCPSASRPVPLEASAIQGKKYQSPAAEWLVDKDRNAGFACLGFEMQAPQYYQYSYAATANAFTARARGDLNGDGVLSDLTWSGRLKGDKLEIDSEVTEKDADE